MTRFPLLAGALMVCVSASWPAAAEMIHLMARKGDAQKVSEILASGVSPDLPSTRNTTKKGMSPLYVASQFGHEDVVRVLIEAGADVNFGGTPSEGDNYWGNPLLVAAGWGHAGVVRILLDAGADPDAVSDYYGTPLSLAKRGGHDNIATMLVAAGAPERIEAPSILADLADADLAAGEARAGQCKICHLLSLDGDGGPMQGPNLWGVVGRKMAAVDGFDYSEAVRERSETWDYDALNSFLASPHEYLPGMNMYIRAIRDTEDRVNLIAYLRTLSDALLPLP